MAETRSAKIELLKSKILKIADGDKAEVNYHLDELVEEVRREAVQTKRKLGNPAVVGMAGFALSSALLQFQNLGWTWTPNGTSPVILCLGVVFGGFAQLIAGFMEFVTGNNFGFCAFSTYGAFWISFVGIQLWNKFAPSKVEEGDISLYLLVFAVFTLIMLIGSSRESLALFLVFLFLFFGIVLLVASHFCPNYEKANGHPIKKTAGAILLIDALGPLYIMAHIIYLEVFKYDVLPVGPPLNQLFKGGRRSVPAQA